MTELQKAVEAKLIAEILETPKGSERRLLIDEYRVWRTAVATR